MPVLPPSTDRVDLILQFFCLLRGGSNLIHVKSDAAAAPARYNNAQPVIGYQHFTVMAPVQNGSLSPSSLSLSLLLLLSYTIYRKCPFSSLNESLLFLLLSHLGF